MINAVLIDDEEPALIELEFLLKNYPEVHILEKFLNPLEALEKIKELKPQVVFIDMNMPGLSGLTLTKKLQEMLSGIDVVFVTAYEQYAVEAFHVEARDYLLKPVSKERLDKTIQRLKSNIIELHCKGEQVLEIRCMDFFQIAWVGKEPIKWRTEKEKELFAFLLHHKGLEVSRDRIIDELWGELETDRAIRQLHNAIYYMKKTLAEYGITSEQIDITKHYCLSLGKVQVDREQLEDKIRYVKDMQTTEELEAVLSLFGNGYLQFEGWGWAEQDRALFKRYQMKLQAQLAQKYREAKRYEQAELLLENAYYINPFEENITYNLMELYKETGEIAKATQHFLAYQKILKVELNIKPQDKVVKLYETIGKGENAKEIQKNKVSRSNLREICENQSI